MKYIYNFNAVLIKIIIHIHFFTLTQKKYRKALQSVMIK